MSKESNELSSNSVQGFIHALPADAAQQVEALMKQIRGDRAKYTELVNQHYCKEHPFPAGRKKSKENFHLDINRYLELIGHCLIAGDSKILYQWGIELLDTEEGKSRLAGAIESYQAVFELRFKDSQSPREKAYLKILIDELSQRSGKPPSSECLLVK